MTTFSLHHGQLPIPFLRPKPTSFLCPSLIRNPFLSFNRPLPRRTGSPPVVSSLSRFISEDPPPIPIRYEDDEHDPFYDHLGEPEPEDVSRKRSWTDRGWAPWEEILTPEAEFARTSLDEGYEVPLTSPEAIEAFKMLTPSYRKKKIAEIGEEEYINRLFAIKGEIPDKLKTTWAGPLALQLIPPRDWPPKGWEVDKEELEFIREAHKLQSVRVDVGGGGNWIGAPGFEESLMEVLKGGKEIHDAVFGENKELGTKIKEWAKANPDRLKMDDAWLMMKDDILKHYKELVGSNRDEGPKGEGIGEVEKAVKGYLEFLEKLKGKANANTENPKQEETDIVNKMAFERYKVFIKQYTEWVDANRDKLEEESYKFDQDYYPGRRKRGKDYNEEMLELPFIYPGQIYQGKVISISLYQGAFVDIGGVHDGWVPIKGNDWYWIRHHIKVGMPVLVEILAKRDPYRFRFPIEMRFVQPNIDHLIFNKFDFPPVFHRDEDTNPHERQRESGRELIPKRRPEVEEDIAKLPLISDHPYVDELWHIHNAEQMILDHEEENPDEYKDKKFEETVDPSFDEENSVEYTKAYYKDALLPKMILNTNLKDLNMDAARAERQRNNRLQKEAEQRGEEFKISKLWRNLQMDEYDLLHWKRSLEEREALLRDISCRTAVGLPLEQPGKYNDDPKFWGDEYHKSNPLFQSKLVGDEEKKIKKEKVDAARKYQYQKILGNKASKWYEMSYDGLIARRALFEAQRKKREERKKREGRKKKEEKEAEELKSEGEELKSEGEEKEVDDYNDDIDFDYRIFGRPVAAVSKSKPVINGTDPPTVDDTSEE
ncbi:nucleic acid-binding, OB-fold-like protein isoform X2 [Carex rostrata]